MKNAFFPLVAGFLVLWSQSSFAACFNLAKPVYVVGPIRLAMPADTVCTHRVSRISGGTYYSVRFSDAQGDLAQLASQTESNGRCLNYCKNYILTSGNSNGQNVNPDNTSVTVTVENSGQGKLDIFYRGNTQSYPLVNAGQAGSAR